ncbi:hypothetical protein [Methylomonas albis]|uniref:GTP cyclohydrolase II domain-containing protein n=1 Tax=Methylomonas albis TaxID=1854563 RepID=A0ABR9D2B7_9GAMM|nr:hypothetical protein [Methylomonas albis]MBD9356946.1 hypothetical protein [Methylomonas albis]
MPKGIKHTLNTKSQAGVSRLTTARIPTAYSDFQLYYYRNTLDNKEHLAFVMSGITDAENVLVRLYSECVTGYPLQINMIMIFQGRLIQIKEYSVATI